MVAGSSSITVPSDGDWPQPVHRCTLPDGGDWRGEEGRVLVRYGDLQVDVRLQGKWSLSAEVVQNWSVCLPAGWLSAVAERSGRALVR